MDVQFSSQAANTAFNRKVCRWARPKTPSTVLGLKCIGHAPVKNFMQVMNAIGKNRKFAGWIREGRCSPCDKLRILLQGEIHIVESRY